MSRRSPLVIRHAARVAEAHDHDVEHLGDDGDDEEQHAEADDLVSRRAVGGLVDDSPNDQRTGERACRGRGDERAEDCPSAGIRPDQRCQGAPARRRCLRHVISLAARGGRRGGFQPSSACSAIERGADDAGFVLERRDDDLGLDLDVRQPLVGLAADSTADDEQVG